MPYKYQAGVTYADVEKFVRQMVGQAVEMYHLDLDDVIEAAYFGFMRAFAGYRSNKGEFTTWCGFKVKKSILDLVRKRAKESKRPREDAELDQLVEDKRPPFDQNELMDRLSEDGQFVASLVLSPPTDIRATLIILGRDSPGNWRYAIRDFLRDSGWTVRRVAKAFQEIKGAL